MESGAQFVMMLGISTTQMWRVVSLASLTHLPLSILQLTVQDLVLFGWRKPHVKEGRRHFLIALILAGECITVIMSRMLVLIATLEWAEGISNIPARTDSANVFTSFLHLIQIM